MYGCVSCNNIEHDEIARNIKFFMFIFSVKFLIMPEGHVQSMTCSLKQSFLELRNHFASEFSQPPQAILMIFDGKLHYFGSKSMKQWTLILQLIYYPTNSLQGKMVEDHTVLSDLGVQAGQTVEVEIQSSDPINTPLQYKQSSPMYKLPDKINVRVEVGKFASIFCSVDNVN